MLLKKSAANNVCTDDDADDDGTMADVEAIDAIALLLLRRFFGCGVESSPVVNGFVPTGVIGLDLKRK